MFKNLRNWFLIIFFGCFSQVLLGWNYFGELKCCAQRLIDKTEKWGQSYVDAICNIDCGSSHPKNYLESAQWVQAKDWRHHADKKKMPQAQGLLALAGLSQICLASSSLDNLATSHDAHGLAKQGDAILAHANLLPVCYHNESLTAALPVVELGPQLNAVQKPVEVARLYNTQDLIYLADAPWGRNKGKVYQTKAGSKLYVKERHLKGPYDSLLVSYFTYKLGQMFCPGQIVTIVPVIDGEDLKIASFNVDGFIGHIAPETKNQMLLFLVLDLMNIMDRGRQNIGHIESNKLACAVDVDLLDFPDVIDANIDWIHWFKNQYPYISDDFKEALQHIDSFDINLFDFLVDAESELRGVLPSHFHDIFGHPHLYMTKYKAHVRKQQMRWVLEHYDVVAKIVNDEHNEIPLESLVDANLQREDQYGFFLSMAIERNDINMIRSLCMNDIPQAYSNIFIWAHHRKKNKSLLKNIQNHCLHRGNLASLYDSYKTMISRLD